MAKKNILVFLPAVIWGIIILTLSSVSGATISQFNWSDFASMDKVGHFIFYSIFTFLWLFGFQQYGLPKSLIRKILTAWTIGAVFGGLIEIFQFALIEGRYFDLLDLLANILGCIAGVVIFMIIKHYRLWIFQ